MTWALAVGAGISLVSGALSRSAAKHSAKEQARQIEMQSKADSAQQVRMAMEDAAQKDKYERRQKADTYKGRMAYGAYNSLDSYAPELVGKSTGPSLDDTGETPNAFK